MLTGEIISNIENNLARKSIGIIGDFCIDVYWDADMTKSELSRETPNFPLPVVRERIYLGAGGNVAANLAELHPANLYALCLTGCDWRGDALKKILREKGISEEFVITSDKLVTNAYCKPMRKGISDTVYEDARLDFENRQPLPEEVEALVEEKLKALLEKSEVIVVADQFRYGIVTPKIREMLCDAAKNGKTVICDSRYNIGEYYNCILKPNEVECYRALHDDNGYLTATAEDFTENAKTLSARNNAVVFCTLGARGSVVVDGGKASAVSPCKVEGPLDICGAGDTSLSAFSAALASGESPVTAADFAGHASSVTIRKVGITGTASFEEIRKTIR